MPQYLPQWINHAREASCLCTRNAVGCEHLREVESWPGRRGWGVKVGGKHGQR